MENITDKEFADMSAFIKDNYGIKLGPEKKSLIFSRLSPLLLQKGFDSFSQYFAYLKGDKKGDAITDFINRITTNHTFFMREPDHFQYFKEEALPYIERRHGDSKDLRVWCAGCSSGEEPYTLQMITSDYFANKPDWNIQILATDISAKALAKAVEGVYPNESVASLPKEWQSKYFKRYDDGNRVVTDNIKKNVIYRKLNFMDEFSFKKPLQVIFCRNVMIYFDTPTKDKLLNKFYKALEPDGFFFVGHSESLSQLNADFRYVAPAAYRK